MSSFYDINWGGSGVNTTSWGATVGSMPLYNQILYDKFDSENNLKFYLLPYQKLWKLKILKYGHLKIGMVKKN